MYNSEYSHLRANFHTTPTVLLYAAKRWYRVLFLQHHPSPVYAGKVGWALDSSLEDEQTESCGGAEVSFSPSVFSNMCTPPLFLSGPVFHPRPPSPSPPPSSPVSLLSVYLSACYPPPPHTQSRSVTGEFPELITGGYSRVQRGPAHLQAEGAREGCLITFSTA